MPNLYTLSGPDSITVYGTCPPSRRNGTISCWTACAGAAPARPTSPCGALRPIQVTRSRSAPWARCGPGPKRPSAVWMSPRSPSAAVGDGQDRRHRRPAAGLGRPAGQGTASTSRRGYTGAGPCSATATWKNIWTRTPSCRARKSRKPTSPASAAGLRAPKWSGMRQPAQLRHAGPHRRAQLPQCPHLGRGDASGAAAMPWPGTPSRSEKELAAGSAGRHAGPGQDLREREHHPRPGRGRLINPVQLPERPHCGPDPGRRPPAGTCTWSIAGTSSPTTAPSARRGSGTATAGTPIPSEGVHPVCPPPFYTQDDSVAIKSGKKPRVATGSAAHPAGCGCSTAAAPLATASASAVRSAAASRMWPSGTATWPTPSMG